MAKADDFFIPDNSVGLISEASYESLGNLIDEIDAFSRLTYKSVYIIDYYRRNFLYVAPNPLFLCGYTPDEVKESGYNFYIENVPQEDLKFLLEINVKGFEFLKNIPAEEKKEYTISYCFHIINKESGKKQLINHQITPLRLTKSGEVWLALCVASIPSNGTSGEILMSRNGAGTQWRYSREGCRWKEEPRYELKDLERDVLKYSMMGYTMNEIAEIVHRSFDTVKVYRKQILEKLGAENIAEAIVIAMNHRLI